MWVLLFDGQHHIGDTSGSHTAPVLIGDDDFVGGAAPAQVDRRAFGIDQSAAPRLVVGDVQVHAHRVGLAGAVQGGGHRAQCFGQRGRGPAVQDAHHLGVSLYRHGRGELFHGEVGEHDAQLVG